MSERFEMLNKIAPYKWTFFLFLFTTIPYCAGVPTFNLGNAVVAKQLRGETTIPWDVRLSWLENAHSRPHFSRRAILTCKLGQTDLVFAVGWGLISRFVHAIDYKCLCAAVTICATLVNIETHRQTAFWLVYMSSWAKNEDLPENQENVRRTVNCTAVC